MKLIWPPEQTISYKFNDELELVIPLLDNKKDIEIDRN